MASEADGGPALSLKAMLRTSMARGAMGTMVMKVVSLGLGLLVNILLARWLSPAGFGLYAFAFTVATLLSMPLRSGMGNLVVREMAVYQQQKRWSLMKGLLRAANLGVAAATVLAVAILLAVVWWRGGDSEDPSLWWWTAALVPLYALGGLRGAALRGLRRPIFGLLPEHVLRPAFLLVLLLLLGWSAAAAVTPSRAMGLHVVAMGIAFLVGVVLLVRALPKEMSGIAPEYAWPAWLRALLPFTLLAGIQVINGSLDILMLGVLSTNTEVGLFRAAEQFAGLVGFSLLAVNLVLAPQLARAFAAGEKGRAQRLVAWSARATFAFAAPIGLVFLVAGEPVLQLLYGPDYAPAWDVLAVLSFAALVGAACGPVGVVLNMAGFERESVRAVALAVAVNFALGLVLIPKYGALGAATATATAMIAWNLVLVFRVRRLTGLGSTLFSSPRLAA